MKKTNFYVIGALLIIAGLVWYFFLRKPKPAPTTAMTPAPTTGGTTTGTTGGTTTGGTTTGTTTGAPDFIAIGQPAAVIATGYPVYFENIADDYMTPATPAFYTKAENLNGLLGTVQEIKDFNDFYFTPYPRKKFAKLFYSEARPEIWIQVEAIKTIS